MVCSEEQKGKDKKGTINVHQSRYCRQLIYQLFADVHCNLIINSSITHFFMCLDELLNVSVNRLGDSNRDENSNKSEQADATTG